MASCRTLTGVTGFEERREAEFSRCFEAEVPRLLRYAQRHVGEELAQDVVAETFQIAWRKWDSLPDTKFPWLVGTARKVIGNHIRAAVRRRRLAFRLTLLSEVAGDTGVDMNERLDALERLAVLSDKEREALLLVAWDGLSNEEAARALNISAAAFRKRLSRARQSMAASDAAAPRTAEATESEVG